MRRKLTAAALCGLVVAGASTAGAAGGRTTATERDDGRVAAAVTARHRELGATGAPSGPASAAPGGAPAASCGATTVTDPVEAANVLDVVTAAMAYDCDDAAWGLEVELASTFRDIELDGLVAFLDTDQDATTGCLGADAAASVLYDPVSAGLMGLVFAMDSCDAVGWVPLDVILVERPAPFSIALTIPDALLGGPAGVDWWATISDIYDPGVVDRVPDVGTATLVALPPPPPPTTTTTAPTTTTTTTTAPTTTTTSTTAPAKADAGPPEEPTGTPGALRFVPVAPSRLVDTRTGLGRAGPLTAGTTVELTLAGRGPVASDAVAVAVNLTATAAAGPGFLVAWPAGQPQPATSSLNIDHAGQTVANLAVVPLGTGGAISVHPQAATDLVVDVWGYWVPSQGPTRDGRLLTLSPTRLLDTRRDGFGAPLRDDTRLELAVAGRGEVPADASAVVLNVTAVDPTGPGFVTLWSGGTRPEASALNVDRPGHTVANLAVVPVDDQGRVTLYVQTSTHVVVDVVGAITGPGADLSQEGLLVPIDPVRLLDTRRHEHPGRATAGGQRTELEVAPLGAQSLGTPGAALLHVTITEPHAPGYVAVWPSAADRPATSNLNVAWPGQTVANQVVTRWGHDGRVTILSQADAEVVVDLTGYLLGPTATSAGPFQPPVRTRP